MSEQRLEGFAKAKTATPFIASEQERQDNIFGFGQAQFVIPHLLRDLKEKIRSRNESGMTVISCHCEAERSEAVAIAKSLELNGITTSCAAHTPRNDKNLSCLRDVLAEGSQDNPPTLALPLKGGREKLVNEAHSKELNVLTSYRLNDFKKKIAFTLAEVLITLGIIGVVAAMTIPTISSNIQHAVLKNQFKKFYSTFWQAVSGIQTLQGRPVNCYYWDTSHNPYTGVCTIECTERNEYDTCIAYQCAETQAPLPNDITGPTSGCRSFYKELFLNTLKTTKVCQDHAYEQGCLPENFRGVDIVNAEKNPDKEYDPNTNFSDSNVKNNYSVFVLSDGTYIIKLGNYLTNAMPVFVVDINGHKGPNKWGYDIFGLHFSGESKNGIRYMKGVNYTIEPGGKGFQEMYDECFK